MCRDKWKIDVGREINNETRERRGKKERKKERRKENERKMKSSMDLWFETLSGGLIAAVFMGGGWPPSPKWIACSTPFNSGFQQVDDGLIPLIFRENHPRKSGGILNPDKWENDPRRVSRATGTRFSGWRREPVNKFVFTMSDQSAGYFCLRLSRPSTNHLLPPLRGTHKYSGGGGEGRGGEY